VMAGLRFILLLVMAMLRLFASCVIVAQMLRHAVMVDGVQNGGHYMKQPITATSLS
jgi:homoserine acetyltransferase